MMFFENLTYLGVCFIPVFILLIGLIFAHTKIKFTWSKKLLFLIPLISTIMIWTNNYHHLFYVKFSLVTNETIFGRYFIIHSVYSYICIAAGLYYLLYFSIKNSGFFSRQSILIFIGSIIPVGVNIFVTLKILPLNSYMTPITFSFAILCYMFAMLKFQFLNVVPVALQSIVDRISDSFIVINEELNIIDYNRSFIDTFKQLFEIRRNDNLITAIESNSGIGIDGKMLISYINKARKEKIPIVFEWHLEAEDFDKYFTVEITAIISRESYIGTIILLKDITQNKKDLEIIKENQTILMEQDRLASLGQLIGGIAHNLKTPIMSISGAIEGLKDLVEEYRESISDKEVTVEDHLEIAAEMKKWLEKMKPHCSYMSDIITAVKGQAVQMSSSAYNDFTIDELIKRIDVLMKHELKVYNCIMKMDVRVSTDLLIKGEVSSLVQIMDNIIMNAIQSYDSKNGKIDFIVEDYEGGVLFTLRDYGKGIPPQIKEKLFKEMVTTKGKNGTGLGLYMSYSTVRGRLSGNMWFESEQGKGTAFFISIPTVSSTSTVEQPADENIESVANTV